MGSRLWLFTGGFSTAAHDENLREELVDVLVVCQQMFLALKMDEEDINKLEIRKGIAMKITAKAQHYLRSAWYYDKKSNFLNDKISVLRSKAEKITTSYQDNPTFGGFEDHRQKVIAEMVDLEREYEKARTLCRNKRKEVEFVINLLENYQEKIVLEMRYLNYYDWQEIAIQLNYSIQAVYYIHGRALMHILEVNKQAEQTSGKPFF